MEKVKVLDCMKQLTDAIDSGDVGCHVDSETGSNYEEGYLRLKDSIVTVIGWLNEERDYDWMKEL